METIPIRKVLDIINMDSIGDEPLTFSILFTKIDDGGLSKKEKVRKSLGENEQFREGAVKPENRKSNFNAVHNGILTLYDCNKKTHFSCRIDLLMFFNGYKIVF